MEGNDPDTVPALMAEIQRLRSRIPRRALRLTQALLGLSILLVVLRESFRLEVPNLAMDALALSAVAGLGFITYSRVKKQDRRLEPEGAILPPDGRTYRAYTGMGVLFAIVLSLPGMLFAGLFFLYLLAFTRSGDAAIVGGGLLFGGWFGFCLWYFVPMTLQVLPTGVQNWLAHSHNRGRTPVVPWSLYKGRHLIGPVFYVPGPLWSIPISWFVVRGGRDFRRDLTEHAGQSTR